MKKIFLIINFILPACNTSISQSWIGVSGGTDGDIKNFFVDTVDDRLFVGGWFAHAGGQLVNQIAYWDGNNWGTLGTGGDPSNIIPVTSFARYRDTLIAAGDFFHLWTYYVYLAKFNYVSWDSLSHGVNDIIQDLKVWNDTLYVAGYFDHADNVYAPLFAKWDGTHWSGFNIPLSYLNVGLCTQPYQGKLYFGGIFNDTASIISNIMMLDNGQFLPVGSALSNPQSGEVYRMKVFKGELYIAGEFGTNPASLGRNIIKWDGNSYSSVSGGTDFPVSDMVVFGDNLYVVGAFNHAGGIPVSHIARWDGQNWYPVGNSTFNNIFSTVAVFRNELYVGGGFTQIDSSNVNYIAKFTSPLTTRGPVQEEHLSLYPNPFHDHLSVYFQSMKTNNSILRIFNPLGEEVFYRQCIVGSTIQEISTSHWYQGLYLILLQTDQGTTVQKAIKE